MTSFFVIFACEDSEDSRKLLSHFCGAIFQFYPEKCHQDVEDAEISELCGSAPAHPVRCPDIMKCIVTVRRVNILSSA